MNGGDSLGDGSRGPGQHASPLLQTRPSPHSPSQQASCSGFVTPHLTEAVGTAKVSISTFESCYGKYPCVSAKLGKENVGMSVSGLVPGSSPGLSGIVPFFSHLIKSPSAFQSS